MTLVPTALKMMVAGGFGVGKTTTVRSISEIEPLDTEAPISGIDPRERSPEAIPGKATTTVALDFGRITVAPDLVLYLFGTPGQDRFSFMWDEIARGAVGMLVIADTRRLETSFPAVDYCEHRRIPFAVAVNVFDHAPRYSESAVRDATAVCPDVPVRFYDARVRESVKTVLAVLVEHALDDARRALAS